jgi:phosphatidylserine/phosphatidylglycerophosphate/cardiolipin synthase-like enzyme
MPVWAWWGLVSGGLCLLSWLYGRLSRPQAPAGNGPWDTSWAVYFSPNGGAARAILKSIGSAQQTILVQVHLLYSMRLAGALVRAHQRGVQVHVILDANAQPHAPRSRRSRSSWGQGSQSPLMITMNGPTTKS